MKYLGEATYSPDVLPANIIKTLKGNKSKNLHLLQCYNVCLGVHRRAAKEYDIEEYANNDAYIERVKGSVQAGKLLKKTEVEALDQFARDHDLYLDSTEFDNKWKEQGERGGAEHNIIYDEEIGAFYKANVGSIHRTYLSYFHRMLIHNAKFPNTAVQLIGFLDGNSLDKNEWGYTWPIMPVIVQEHISVKSDGYTSVTEAEIEKLMKQYGFKPVKDHITKTKVYTDEDGIEISDLHDENVLRGEDGKLYVIDPDIMLTFETKMERIKNTPDLSLDNFLRDIKNEKNNLLSREHLV